MKIKFLFTYMALFIVLTLCTIASPALAQAADNGSDDSSVTENSDTPIVEEGEEPGQPADEEKSVLPDELTALFAGLGMFFAMMAIMAAGTEVVIDTIKVSLGMKNKITSLEAFERMEKLIPGQLKELGVDAAAIKEFEEFTKEFKDQKLKVISNTSIVIEDVKQGKFNSLIAHLNALGINTEAGKFKELRETVESIVDVTNNTLDALKDAFIKQIEDVLKLFDKIDSLPKELSQLGLWDILKQQLNDIKSEVQVLSINSVPDAKNEFLKIKNEVEALTAAVILEIESWSATATSAWLEDKKDELLKIGQEEATKSFKEYVSPQLALVDPILKTLGYETLSEKEITAFKGGLDILFGKADTEAQMHLDSLGNLLQGVEARRNEIQSPLRKLWRRIRSAFSEKPFWRFVSIVVLSIFVAPISGLVLQIVDDALWLSKDLKIGSLPTGFFVTLILLALFSVAGWLINRSGEDEIDKRTYVEYAEIAWNALRGDELEPMEFGKPKSFKKLAAISMSGDKKAEEITLEPENAAEIMLLRTNQQQDEEKSRLRLLRVLSVVVGMILAYVLQIDAAALLDKAVPGIEGIINGTFHFTGEQLHAAGLKWLHPQRSITAGIVLTGFAAAAGSAFWHNQLNRLQAAKKGAETAAELMNQVKELSESKK